MIYLDSIQGRVKKSLLAYVEAKLLTEHTNTHKHTALEGFTDGGSEGGGRTSERSWMLHICQSASASVGSPITTSSLVCLTNASKHRQGGAARLQLGSNPLGDRCRWFIRSIFKQEVKTDPWDRGGERKFLCFWLWSIFLDGFASSGKGCNKSKRQTEPVPAFVQKLRSLCQCVKHSPCGPRTGEECSWSLMKQQNRQRDWQLRTHLKTYQ